MPSWLTQDRRTRTSWHCLSSHPVLTAPYVTLAVEGDLDERVAIRLVGEAGGAGSLVHGKRGKPWLRERIGGYLNAARHSRWLVLVDLDDDTCPPELRVDWGVADAPLGLCFRVAVRSVESWLLADRERLARFLGTARSRIPTRPDEADDPKQSLINAARRSRSGRIRDAIVPRPGARVGPLYTSTLSQFVDELWNPTEAAEASPSLARCRTRLAEFIAMSMPA